MTILEQSSTQIVSEKRRTVPAGPEETATESTQDTQDQRESRVAITRAQARLLGPAFVVGLIVGWIVIGWWLWPVKWSNSEPWLLRPEHQRTYVELVAENYWHSQDLSRAREAVAGWDEEDLTQLLSTLQTQAATPEARQQIAALAQALALPDPNTSLLASLLGQRTLVLSAVLSASPLLAALVLGVFPLLKDQTRTKKPKQLDLLGQGVEELEEELDGLLRAEEGEGDQEEWQAATEAGAGGEGSETQGQEAPEDELEEGGASEAWEEEANEEDGEAEGDTWLDEEVGEEGQAIEDIFADIFHEEDESFADLEALCKNLPDVDMEELAQDTQQTLDQLIRSNWLQDD